MSVDLSPVLPGIAAGVSYALSGYAKNKGDKFDGFIFGRTVILGACAGLGMAIAGFDIEISLQYFVSLGFVPVVENALKAIHRRLLKVKKEE